MEVWTKRKVYCLEILKKWGKVDSELEFWQRWLRHDNEEERMTVYQELCYWMAQIGTNSIEEVISVFCEVLARTLRYEKRYPLKPRLITMHDAEELFEVFDWYMSK